VRDLAAALRGLTVRGRSFLAAGAACAVSATVLGEQDLLRVALLLMVLPLAAALFVSRTRYRLACTRRIEPPRVAAGQSANVRVRLDNMSRLPSSVLLVEDHVPDGVAAPSRFVVDRIEPGGTRDLSYEIKVAGRGRYQLGPMSIRLADPFGFCELTRSFRSQDELVVTPEIERLPRSRSMPLAAASRLRRAALRGEEEATTRPYRPGDDMRRVHWRTTARTGELMVRREDAPRLGGATVLLDDHLGSWGDDTGADSPFEWAVRATGSIAVHLASSGFGVRLVTHEGLAAVAAAANPAPLLDELATIVQVPPIDHRPAFAAVAGSDGGMVVLVLGRTAPEVTRRLSTLRPRSSPGIAVLVAGDHWGVGRQAAASLARCAQTLEAQGWRVLVANARTRLADQWPRLMRPGVRSGTAGPAAAANGASRQGVSP
jgi:uncharacterized protein (DUF58 family)